jgi:hypothetical protein
MALEADQVDLLLELIEAALAVDRAERKFYLSRTDEADVLHGPGGSRVVLGEDIYDLISAGLLRRRGSWVGGDVEFTIAPEGLAYAEQRGAMHPMERIADTAPKYLDEPSFRTQYPLAYQRWQDAANLLWSESSLDELTTIGHKTREAVQEFATTLVELAGLHGAVDNDPSHTVARIRGVLNANRDRLGSARYQLLDALLHYWGEVNDLLQRQEHGGQKEGQPLSWDDGRRAVFHTAVVMYELDRTIRPG